MRHLPYYIRQAFFCTAVLALAAGCANGERNGDGTPGGMRGADAIIAARILDVVERAADHPGGPPEFIVLVRAEKIFKGDVRHRVVNLGFTGEKHELIVPRNRVVFSLSSHGRGLVVLDPDGSALTLGWRILSGGGAVRPATPEVLQSLGHGPKKSAAALSDGEKKKAVHELESLLGRGDAGAASRREELLKKIGEDAATSLLNALGSKDPVVRRTSVVLLGSVFSDRVAAAFGKLARDPNPRVRLAAAWILEHEATVPAMRALESFLLDAEEEVRVSAYSGLGYSGVSESFPVVALGLRDVSPRVRAATARSLGFLGNPDAIPDIENAIERETDRSVLSELIRACGKIKSESSRRVLAWGLASGR
ncbi:MAG: HEAT repeat domain-containing protein, partial [Planctomycetota bacterium]